jgi:hypothetical protein
MPAAGSRCDLMRCCISGIPMTSPASRAGQSSLPSSGQSRAESAADAARRRYPPVLCLIPDAGGALPGRSAGAEGAGDAASPRGGADPAQGKVVCRPAANPGQSLQLTQPGVDIRRCRQGQLAAEVLFPTPEALSRADPQGLKALGMPLRRAEALIHLSRAACQPRRAK